MAYDEILAGQVEDILRDVAGLTFRKMFGSLCFMINGNIAVCVSKDRLMVRVGPDNYEKAMKMKHTSVVYFSDKPITTFVYVEPEGLRTQKSIEKWVMMGVEFAGSLKKK
ncbi:MAG: TfoX/Sxy family protein [Candidatus Zixiibacteriota bacterium]